MVQNDATLSKRKFRTYLPLIMHKMWKTHMKGVHSKVALHILGSMLQYIENKTLVLYRNIAQTDVTPFSRNANTAELWYRNMHEILWLHRVFCKERRNMVWKESFCISLCVYCSKNSFIARRMLGRSVWFHTKMLFLSKSMVLSSVELLRVSAYRCCFVCKMCTDNIPQDVETNLGATSHIINKIQEQLRSATGLKGCCTKSWYTLRLYERDTVPWKDHCTLGSRHLNIITFENNLFTSLFVRPKSETKQGTNKNTTNQHLKQPKTV